MRRGGVMKVAVVLSHSRMRYETIYAVFVKDELWSSFKRAARGKEGVFSRRTTLERYGYTVPLSALFNRLPQGVQERVPLFFENVEEFSKWCVQHATKLFRTEKARKRVLERLREVLETAEQYEAPGPMPRRSKYKAVKLAVFEWEEPPSYIAIRRAGRALYDDDDGMLREYSGSYLVYYRSLYDAYVYYLFIRKNTDGTAFVEELAEMSDEDRKVVKKLLRKGTQLAERAGRRDIADLFAMLLSLGELLLD